MSKENELLIEEEVSVNETEKKPVKKTEKAEKKPEKKQEKKIAAPFLFFNKNNRIEISVYGYHSQETGELQFAVLEENKDVATEELEKIFTKVNYKFWFSRCPYDKLNRYRSRSMIYNSEDQNNTINELQLREYFLVYHLVDWNLKDENGEKIELKFDPNGALSDETLELIYTLPSILIDIVLSSYEKKASIS